jgi:hypothetical protein
MFVPGTVRFVFERPTQSQYSTKTSYLSCTSISQCFYSEDKKKVSDEFGTTTDETSLPPQYDPCTWGWELTGLGISKLENYQHLRPKLDKWNAGKN